MPDMNITNTFSAGETITAAKFNTNFTDVKNYINARNQGSTKWDDVSTSGDVTADGNASISTDLTVGGNASITGTLSVGGTPLIVAGSDGWTSANQTWTYASSTTFTISGDLTARYSVGDKIKMTQSSTVKYFYIVGVSYSAPNTTVTVSAGNVSTIANAAITDNYYSKMETPNGFPAYFTYTASIVGWTTPSTKTGFFFLRGKMCTVSFLGQTGTSNNTATQYTLPFTADLGSSSFSPAYLSLPECTDNGTMFQTAYALPLSNTGIQMSKSVSAGWTASGSKALCAFVYQYAIA